MVRLSMRARYFAGFIGFLVLVLILLAPARTVEAQVTPEADLSVQKFDFPPDRVAVGETLFYELAIANLGPDTATNATVTDTLPANTEFLSTFSGNCTNTGRTVTCDLGDLAPNEQASVEFVVCPTAPGTATNTATASSDTLDSYTSNNTATETTVVTTPAAGQCPSQQSPPPGNPPPDPRPPMDDPQPDPIPPMETPEAPDSPQPEEPVAGAGLCFAGAVAIKTEDFSIACAGGQAISLQGDVPDGNLSGGEPLGEDTAVTRAVAGDGGALAQKP